MRAAHVLYDDITVGAVYEFARMITKDDVMRFAELSGDRNPLHVDPTFGAKSQFGKNVIHGMLAASLFSTLVGMYCPGERALYMSQTLQFRNPIFYGDHLIIRGIVVEKNDSIRLMTLKTEIVRGKEVMISGEAKIKVL